MNRYSIALVFKKGTALKLFQVIVWANTTYYAKTKAEEVAQKQLDDIGWELILKHAILVE